MGKLYPMAMDWKIWRIYSKWLKLHSSVLFLILWV